MDEWRSPRESLSSPNLLDSSINRHRPFAIRMSSADVRWWTRAGEPTMTAGARTRDIATLKRRRSKTKLISRGASSMLDAAVEKKTTLA